MDIFLLKARKHYWVGSSTLGSSQLIFDKFAYITLFCFSVGTEAFLSLSDDSQRLFARLYARKGGRF